ncbi:MAG: AAA family ATPase, partial [bacterium]
MSKPDPNVASSVANGPELIGRAPECAVLDTWVRECLAGQGGLGIVHGPTGVGKTFLLRRFLEQAQTRGIEAVWGQVETGTRSRPPWPWPTVLRRLRATACRQLGRQLLNSSLSTGEDEGLVATGPGLRESMAARLVDALVEAAREEPIITVLDDVQELDTASLALLRLILDSTEDLPLLVIVISRDNEDIEDLKGSCVLEDLTFAAGERILRLGPLGAPQIRRMLGEASTSKLGGEANALQLTGGIPLLAHALRDRSAAEVGSDERDSVPERIAALTHHHLMNLSTSAQEVVEACALAQKAIEPGELARVLGIGVPDLESRLAEHGIPTFLRRETTDGLESLQIEHGLLANAVEQALKPERRRHWHTRFARLALQRAESGAIVDVGETAHHACLAVPPLQGRVAGDWAWRAAREANATGAHTTAAMWAQRGITALEQDAEGGAEVRLDLLVESFIAELGDEVAHSVEQIQEIATQSGALGKKGYLQSVVGILGTPDLESVDAPVLVAIVTLLDKALAACGPADKWHAPVLARQALIMRALGGSDNLGAAKHLARESHRLADRLESGDPRRIVPAIARLRCDPWGLSPPERVIVATSLEAPPNDPTAAAGVNIARIFGMTDQLIDGDLTAAAQSLAVVEEFSARTPRHELSWMPSHRRAVLAAMRLDRNGVSQHLAASLAAAHHASYQHAWGAALVLAAQLHEFIGEWVPVEGFVTPAEAHRHRVSPRRFVSVKGEGVEGILTGATANELMEIVTLKNQAFGEESEQARAGLTQRVREGFAEPERDDWLVYHCLLAEASAKLRHAESAQALLSALRPFADRFNVAPLGLVHSGQIGGYLAPLAAVVGEFDEAEELGRRAIAADEEIGLAFYANRDRLDLAHLLVQRGRAEDLPEVETLVAEAAHAVESLGISGLRPWFDDLPATKK